MTLAGISLPLVALALALCVGWLASSALSRGWLALVRRRPELDHTAVATFTIPWMLALAALLAALLPGDPHTGEVLACHCLDSMPGWFHLCPVHPERAWPLLLPAVVALVALLPARLRAVRHLVQLPRGNGGAWPEVVALAEPVAVLHGWWRPTLVVDTGLWSALDTDERRAVLAHEQAHLDRRDPLMLVVLQALLVFAPPQLSSRVVRRWLAGAEHRADAAAAHSVRDPALVAMALVRCARLGSAPASLALGWTSGSVEARVHHLLDLPPDGTPARPDLRRPQVLALMVGLWVCLASVPWLHHHLEHLLNLSV